MSSLKKLKNQWLSDPKVKKAYAAMTPEFALAKTLIAARVKAGLTQQEVAKRMGTTQSAIARLEAGNSLPSMKSLYRYAKATGTTPAIQLRHA
jgi:DNA-binding XRE family transcriptional regulator